MNELENVIGQIAALSITKMIISKPVAKTIEYKKIVIERKKEYFQAAKYTEKQVFHDNIMPADLENYLQVRLEHEYHVWGKDREELRQTKAVLDAQMQVIDLRADRQQKKENYRQEKEQEKLRRVAKRQQKIAAAKRRPEVERKVRQDVLRLKQEVENRRKMEAEIFAAAEIEKSTSRQVEEILQGLL